LIIPDAFALKSCLSAFANSLKRRRRLKTSLTLASISSNCPHHARPLNCLNSASHSVCLASDNILQVSKPQMQPCLYLRASIRGSAIPLVQMRHMHANANTPAPTLISLVTSPQTSLILNLTHPGSLHTYQPLNTHQFSEDNN
jgi:hypothetical protein